MDQEDFTAAPLSPRQKRWLRVGVTSYLIIMGGWTVLYGAYDVGFLYAVLVVADFYLYLNLNNWVRLKNGKR